MSDIDTAAADSLKVLDPERPIREVDIGFAIGSIVRLQVCRESAWRTAGRWESSPGSSPRHADLGWAAPIWSIFCEPTLRTQLHMSVCDAVDGSSTGTWVPRILGAVNAPTI